MITDGSYKFRNVSTWTRIRAETPYVCKDSHGDNLHVVHCDGVKHINLFDYDKVIIPINQKSTPTDPGWHWLFVGK